MRPENEMATKILESLEPDICHADPQLVVAGLMRALCHFAMSAADPNHVLEFKHYLKRIFATELDNAEEIQLDYAETIDAVAEAKRATRQ